MNLKFIVNDYVLIWNLLFQASISENIHRMKQRLWINYKKIYNDTYHEEDMILKDLKNYIPNNDTIYNIILETKEYEKIKKQTEKYRVNVLQLFDEYKKEINHELKDILRFELKPYQILCVHEKMDILMLNNVPSEDNFLTLGRKIDTSHPTKILIDIVYEIVKKEFRDFQPQYREIVQAILELAILNELSTRITKKSHYLSGNSSLNYLKRQIYPYWLMYLDIPKEKMKDYMLRDKILFDADRYAYEKHLKKVSLQEFINFCIRNQKYILQTNELEII